MDINAFPEGSVTDVKLFTSFCIQCLFCGETLIGRLYPTWYISLSFYCFFIIYPLMLIHVYFVLQLVAKEEMYSDMSRHIKECQKQTYILILVKTETLLLIKSLQRTTLIAIIGWEKQQILYSLLNHQGCLWSITWCPKYKIEDLPTVSRDDVYFKKSNAISHSSSGFSLK